MRFKCLFLFILLSVISTAVHSTRVLESLDLDPTDIYKSSETLDLDPTDIYKSSETLHLDPTDIYKSSETIDLDPTDIYKSSETLDLDPTDIYKSSETLDLDPTDIYKSSETLDLDPTDIYKSSETLDLDPTDIYKFSETLDPTGIYCLRWTVDYDTRTVAMELRTNASTGHWMTLGVSNNGGLNKADFCMVWTDAQNVTKFQDIWTDENGIAHVDDQKDCFNEGYKMENDRSVFVFTRKFDSCDAHDNAIEEGTVHVVWAVGPGPVASPEGLDVSKAQHGSFSTRLLRPLLADPPLSADVWSFDVAQHNFKVPKADIYWCKVVQLPEVFKKKHHIVKFESFVTPGNERLVHHMIVKQCKSLPSSSEGECSYGFFINCKKVLAMGLQNFSFPQEAGFSLGGTDSPIHVILEIHYTPPDLVKEWVDSSGLRVYVTPRLRQYDADVLELGLEYRKETALPPGQRLFPVTSRCIASCTEARLPPEGISLFGSRLHSHIASVGMVTRHMRGDEELPEVVRDNHFDVHKQPLWRLRQNVRVLPGDELITTCWFDTTKFSNVTLTGVGTTDEMCLDILYYYPKMELSICKSSVNEQSLNQYFRKYNGEMKVDEDDETRHLNNFRQIEWTPDRVKSLQDLYTHSPIDVQCLEGPDDVPVPGNWNNLTVEPLPPPPPPSSSSSNMCD